MGNCLKTQLKEAVQNDSLPVLNKLILQYEANQSFSFSLKRNSDSSSIKISLVSGAVTIRDDSTWLPIELPATITDANFKGLLTAGVEGCTIAIENYYGLLNPVIIAENNKAVDLDRLAFQEGVVIPNFNLSTERNGIKGNISYLNKNYDVVQSITTVNLAKAQMVNGDVSVLGKYKDVKRISLYKNGISGELLDFVERYIANEGTTPASITIISNPNLKFRDKPLGDGSQYTLAFSTVSDATLTEDV